MNKYISLIALSILFAGCSGPISHATPITKASDSTLPDTCNPILWTPTDGSGQGMTLQVMTDGLNPGGFNSSYCQVGNRVWFQFLVVMPTTTNTSQVKINLPVLGSGVDVAASVGGCFGAPGTFCSVGGWADITPGSYIKFFEVGTQTGAAKWADLSADEIAVSGSYLVNPGP